MGADKIEEGMITPLRGRISDTSYGSSDESGAVTSPE